MLFDWVDWACRSGIVIAGRSSCLMELLKPQEGLGDNYPCLFPFTSMLSRQYTVRAASSHR